MKLNTLVIITSLLPLSLFAKENKPIGDHAVSIGLTSTISLNYRHKIDDTSSWVVTFSEHYASGDDYDSNYISLGLGKRHYLEQAKVSTFWQWQGKISHDDYNDELTSFELGAELSWGAEYQLTKELSLEGQIGLALSHQDVGNSYSDKKTTRFHTFSSGLKLSYAF